MDENGEVKKYEGQPSETQGVPQRPVSSEQVERAKKAWEERNKKDEAEGKPVTEEKKEAQRKWTEKGILPPASGADPRFEGFDAEKYRENESLFELAKELKSYDYVTQERLNEVKERLQHLTVLKGVSDDLSHRFTSDINRAMDGTREFVPSGDTAGAEQEGASISDKYKDRPKLYQIMKDLENLKTLGRLNQQAITRQIQPLTALMETGELTPAEAQQFVKEMEALAGISQSAGEERISRNNVRSIQDVAKIIITDEGEDRWGPIDGVPVGEKSDAPFPLLEKVPGSDKLRINKANFIQWARERTMYHHTNNSRDMQLQITRLVGIVNDFGSTTSIFSMDENRNRYFKDAETGRVLDDLADQLKTEVWLFGNMRNYDLVYKEYMGQDSKLPEFLVNVHNKEELTIGDSMERIMTLSEKYLGSDATEENPQDMKVGDAARKAYEIYYYMSDLGKLREILGENSIFFKKQGLINVFKILEKKAHTEDISEVNMNKINELFDGEKINEAAFINFINPFNDQNKADFNISIARELVRQTVAEKYGLEYGLEKSVKEERTPSGKYRAPERAFLRINTEYAETWAWVMSRFTGAAARNDTNSIGFDAFTKTMQFMKYRLRQSNSSRAGQFGNEYNLGVFKQLTLDFFNGVWVQQGFNEKGRTTPFELMMQLDQNDRQIEQIRGGRSDDQLTPEQKAQIKTIEAQKKKTANRFKFDQSTQKGYATNHIGRAFEIFHNMLGNEELRLDQIVKYEPMYGGIGGRYVIDRTKFEEALKEKFVKPVRYAFSTYPMIDFGKEVQELVSAGDEKKLPVYRKTTVAESIFGPIVTASLKEEMIKMKKEMIKKTIDGNKERKKDKYDGLSPREKEIWKKKRFSKEDKEHLWKEMISGPKADLRPYLWKRAVMARIARDLLSHRIRAKDSKYEYFHHEQIEMFLHALENIPSVEVLGESEEELKFAFGQRFLTEEDMHWIRKESRTTEGRMFVQDVAPNIAGGFLKGLGEGLGTFFKGSFK